jgi:MFS family permease
MAGELGIFETLVRNLNAMGFYGFILPWLLVFALVYGLLSAVSEKTKMDKRVNGLIALAIAFFITAYSNIGTYFIGLFGGASMIIAAGLVIVLFLAMFGISPDATKIEWILGVIILGVILLFVVGGSAISGLRLSDDVIALLFMVFIIIAAIAFVTKGGEKK